MELKKAIKRQLSNYESPYTLEDCACEYCLHYLEQQKCCAFEQCLCQDEWQDAYKLMLKKSEKNEMEV